MDELIPDCIDVLIVTFKPESDGIKRLLSALSSQSEVPSSYLNVELIDNSCDSQFESLILNCITPYLSTFRTLNITTNSENTGFGSGVNQAASMGNSPWIVVLNQDIELEPNCLYSLLSFAGKDSKGGLWEARQIPYEHPKIYNPVSLSTSWASGAVFLVRRTVFENISGFDSELFMYAEDVDLSWRIRASGYYVRYIPWAAAVHKTYTKPAEVKPLQLLEGTLSNLRLRAKYGTWGQLLIGLIQLMSEMLVPQAFPGRRIGLIKVFLRFLNQFWSFRSRGKSFRLKHSVANFSFWNYSIHRDGAFFPFKKRSEWQLMPLVSILIRTCGRPALLREALLTATRQTYPNIQVIVVEDGASDAKSLIKSEFSNCNIKYESLGNKVKGRSAAGNKALTMADGEWFCFLDDDDQLFLDHCEVLLQTVLERGLKAAYAWSWEVQTQFKSTDPLVYKEVAYFGRYKQKFSRVKLWHENFLPIQSVMFHRSLYDKCGGLDEDMEQLEDWNLWVRYSLKDEFVMVEKTTSKYRVPATNEANQKRQDQLDMAYMEALKKHDSLTFTTSPSKVMKMLKEFQENQVVIPLYKSTIREKLHRNPVSRTVLRIYRGLKLRFSSVR